MIPSLLSCHAADSGSYKKIDWKTVVLAAMMRSYGNYVRPLLGMVLWSLYGALYKRLKLGQKMKKSSAIKETFTIAI